MFCKYCGAEFEDGLDKCPSCNCDISVNTVDDNTSLSDTDINDNQDIIQDDNINDIADNDTDISSTTDDTKSKKSGFRLNTTILLLLCTSFISILLIILIATQIYVIKKPVAYTYYHGNTTYEYQTLAFYPLPNNSRTGDGSGSYNTISISNETLNKYGAEGWEVVTSYLETETAYPNFGNDKYVTGIQPNIRPQKLVVILKRPVLQANESIQPSK